MVQAVALYHCMLIVSAYNAFFFLERLRFSWVGKVDHVKSAKRYGDSPVPDPAVPHGSIVPCHHDCGRKN